MRRVPAQDDRSSVVKLYEYCQNKSRGFSSQDIEFLYDINGDGTFDCKIRIKDELFDKHLMCRSKRAAKNEMAEYVYNELRKAETSDSANNGETKPQISDSKDSDGSDKKASSKDSNDDRNTTYVTIDKREIPVNIETVVDESIPALLDDIKKCPFEKIEKGIVWENENKTAKYSYQCAFLSLDLTPAEDALISVNIREYAQKQRGLFADDEFWPEIAQRLKYRILIYEYQEGKISRFFEYGKEFEKNGTKRICLETENRHYRKLKGAKAENSKRIINKTFAGTMFNIEDFSNSADRDSKNSDDDDWMNDDSEASDSEE